MDLRGMPRKGLSTEYLPLFSDLGAWHGLSLPTDSMKVAGFTGPWLHNKGWLSQSLVHIVDSSSSVDSSTAVSYPGFLKHSAHTSSGRNIENLLCYGSDRTSLVKFNITNLGQSDCYFSLEGDASIMLESVTISTISDGSGIRVVAGSLPYYIEVHVPKSESSNYQAIVSSDTYTMKYSVPVAAGNDFTGYYTVSVCLSQTECDNEQAVISEMLADPEAIFSSTEERWTAYLNTLLIPELTESEQWLAVKCMEILMTNWRSPAGHLLHNGLYPSFYSYQALWAWDSWKHAAALSLFNIELAKEQIYAMFDYQSYPNEAGFMGMISDTVTFDNSDNWENSKPPLAAWATWSIYEKEGNLDYLSDMFPRLLEYHNWWYENRDHDGDLVCEYGATVELVQPAKWESGMDNAVRFDNSGLESNSENAFSLTQESVDLNSYLYAEKLVLADMASLLGQNDTSQELKEEADRLLQQIQSVFYDSATGWFYDRETSGGDFILNKGAEGWIPLWANAATELQAAAVVTNMLDTNQFYTYFPLPTLAANDPNFDSKGYWRGPVWIDQSYFGIKGMRNYGYTQEADEIQTQFLTNGKGLLGNRDIPTYEYYNPLTGETLGAPFFGWSASHVLLLLHKV
ncbi:glycoside hydrolase [Pelomyxa schiedti]|nr:glycoside hydrolase [Pelomyxa schiedti]